MQQLSNHVLVVASHVNNMQAELLNEVQPVHVEQGRSSLVSHISLCSVASWITYIGDPKD